MSIKIEGNQPKNLDEAIYLLDRNRLPQNDKFRNVRTRSREAAINDLMDIFGEKPEGTEDLPEDYSEWKVDQLKDELERRDLATDGNKADLVARLEENDDEVIA